MTILVSTLAAVLVAVAPAGSGASAPPTAARSQAWQAKIAQVAYPSPKGCFTANYPAMAWRELRCVSSPSLPAVPRRRPRPPAIIGNTNDVSALAPGGALITQATGSFDSVVGVTDESSPIANSGPPVPNAYTLQVNTNFFPTPACAGSPNAGCQGWQQFIYGNDGSPGDTGRVHLQYWLVDYNTACPVGWTQMTFAPMEISCYRDSAASTAVPNQPISELHKLKLVGKVTSSGDNATLWVDSTPYAVIGDNLVNAAAGWNMSEFNIFGYYGSIDGGSMASFNNGAALTVRNRINYGGTEPPLCVAKGFSGETNNLVFSPIPPAPSQPGPAMIFNEGTAGFAIGNCDSAVTVGDTHEHTFAGLKYDFQASGDFVEAQVGQAFEVQTRKASGAPTWPNTSVNKAVATRMGSTKVVVCGEQQLVVDGRVTSVPVGSSLSLPSGVDIWHIGNSYHISDQAGNTVRTTSMPSHVNVSVGVGTWPSKVRGLLGNPDNDVRRLEAKDGTQFTVPLTFDQLYRQFGESWRVGPMTTLLAPCPAVAAGTPSRPFYAGDLNPDVAKRAQGVCVNAKVIQAWLNACTLDVAVLGDNAAAAYAGIRPPVLDGDNGK